MKPRIKGRDENNRLLFYEKSEVRWEKWKHRLEMAYVVLVISLGIDLIFFSPLHILVYTFALKARDLGKIENPITFVILSTTILFTLFIGMFIVAGIWGWWEDRNIKKELRENRTVKRGVV